MRWLSSLSPFSKGEPMSSTIFEISSSGLASSGGPCDAAGLVNAASPEGADAPKTGPRRPWSKTSGEGTLEHMVAGADVDGGFDVSRHSPVESDRVLAARLMAGERDALAETYRRYVGLVFGVCQRVLRDEKLAEDVAQEVFVFLWQSPDRFDASRGSLRAWLGLGAPSQCRSRPCREPAYST